MQQPGLDLETLEFTLESINEFARRELPDSLVIELDERDEFPEEIVRRDVRRGARHPAAVHPRGVRRDGRRRRSTSTASARRMARIDLGIATAVLATFLGSDPITVGGTPEQKQHWLTRIADEGLLFAYGATEPEAGSDLGGAARRPPSRSRTAAYVGYRSTARSSGSATAASPTLYTILANAPGRALLVRRRPRARRASRHGKPRGQARHPREQHRGAVPRGRPRRRRPPGRRRRGPGPAPGPGRCSATRA